MSEDEVDELLKAVDTSSGEINYAGKLKLCIAYILLIFIDLVRVVLDN